MSAVTHFIAEAGTWRRFLPVVSAVSRKVEHQKKAPEPTIKGRSGTMQVVQL